MWDNMLNSISGLWRGFTELLSGEGGRRTSCQNNLKQFGLVFKMFANEHPLQCFPALDSRAGYLTFANENPGMQPVCPEYLTDTSIMICPDDMQHYALRKTPGPELLDNGSYYYLGYAILTIEDLRAFSNAYKAHIAANQPFEEDMDTPNGKLHRLREGVERFLITDLNNPAASAMMQSRIPVLIEPPEHSPAGGNILFMDGHVEFMKYVKKNNFPMDEETMDILKSLIAMKGAAPPK
jgi:prepilin-type processing-associated H-X9-DG protein